MKRLFSSLLCLFALAVLTAGAAEVSSPSGAVKVVFTLDGTTCELVRLEVSGMHLESFCAEHEDPRLVLQVLHALGLDNRPNINYPMGLKHALARWAA